MNATRDPNSRECRVLAAAEASLTALAFWLCALGHGRGLAAPTLGNLLLIPLLYLSISYRYHRAPYSIPPGNSFREQIEHVAHGGLRLGAVIVIVTNGLFFLLKTVFS